MAEAIRRTLVFVLKILFSRIFSRIIHRLGIRLVKAPKVAVCFCLDSMYSFVA